MEIVTTILAIGALIGAPIVALTAWWKQILEIRKLNRELEKLKQDLRQSLIVRPTSEDIERYGLYYVADHVSGLRPEQRESLHEFERRRRRAYARHYVGGASILAVISFAVSLFITSPSRVEMASASHAAAQSLNALEIVERVASIALLLRDTAPGSERYELLSELYALRADPTVRESTPPETARWIEVLIQDNERNTD